MGARKTTLINSQLGAIEGAGYYLGLLTALASASAAGTEVSTANWTNYARVALSAKLGSASGGSIASDAVIDFGTATIPSGTVTIVGAAIYDAATAGNQIYFMALGSAAAKPFTCSAAGTITCYGHGFSNGDSVVLDPIVGASLPTGASASTAYTVANATTDTFTLTGPTISAAGAGMVQKLQSQVINDTNPVTIEAAQFVITEV